MIESASGRAVGPVGVGSDGRVGAAGKTRGRGKAAAQRRREAAAAQACPYERMLRRVRSSLTVIGREQGLLDAYESGGWGDRAMGGGGRRPIIPEGELKRARLSIHREKMKVRECIRFFDESQGDAAIPKEAYDSAGEVGEEHIFCGRCGEYESTDCNDILLCEGFCGRAYHQHCLHPPLLELPPDNEDWLCPACDCKIDAVYALNMYFEWSLPFETPWQDTFAEEAVQGPPTDPTPPGPLTGGPGALDPFLDADLDTESDDEDFDPEALSHKGADRGTSASIAGNEISTSASASSESEGWESGEGGAGGESSGEDGGTSQGAGRRRARVDYAALNDVLFGGAEAYEGEFSDDAGWMPGTYATSSGRKGGRKRVIHCKVCGDEGHNRRTCPKKSDPGRHRAPRLKVEVPPEAKKQVAGGAKAPSQPSKRVRKLPYKLLH